MQKIFYNNANSNDYSIRVERDGEERRKDEEFNDEMKDDLKRIYANTDNVVKRFRAQHLEISAFFI